MTDYSKRRCEVWSHPADPAGFRLLCTPPILDGTNTGERDNAYGKGTLIIPADYDHRALIIESDPTDPGASLDSLVALYMPGATLPYFEFFAEESVEDFDDKGKATLGISGSCLRSAPNEAVVYPRAPGDPNWLWGQPTLTRNPDLTEGLIADEEFDVWVVATAGTWRIDLGSSGWSGTIAWDATAATVKAAIEAGPSSVIECNVVGAGTVESPWKIHIVDPAQTDYFVQVDDASLTGDIFVRLLSDGGDVKATYYTPAQTVDGILFGVQGTWQVEIDPLDGLPSILVAGTSAFIGVQQILSGVAGTHGYATVEIRPLFFGADFRLGIRDIDEAWLYTEEASMVTGSYQMITIPNVQIPEIIDQIILRAAVITDSPPNFYVRNLKFHPGFPGTTAGDIVQLLMAPAVVRGALEWLELDSFDAATDANAAAWDEDELTFRADPLERMGDHVLGDLGSEGYDYEFDVVRLPTPGGGFAIGAKTHALHLWNPDGRAIAAVTTAIVIGSAIGGGKVAKRRVAATHVLVEYGSAGQTVEVTLASLAGLPRREAGLRAEYALDEASAIRAGEAYLQAQVDNMLAVQSALVGNAVVAYRDFDIGSTVPHELGRHAARHNRRVHGISSRLAAGSWSDEVVASELLTGEEAGDELTRRMWIAFLRKDRTPATAVLPQLAPGVGGGGELTISLAAANAPPSSKDKADDTAPGSNDEGAFDAAIARMAAEQGGVLRLSEGDFYLAATVQLPHSIRIEGAGAGSTRIHLADATNANMFELATASGSTVEFIALAMDGNKANQTSGTSNGVYAPPQSEMDLYFESCEIHDFRTSGVHTDRFGSRFEMTSSRVHSNTSHGLAIYFEGSYSVVDNDIYANGGRGIFCDAATQLVIRGNRVFSNTSYGIAGGGTFQAIGQIIDGNYVYLNGNHGIYMNGEAYVLSNNYCEANAGAGIAADGVNDPALVSGNHSLLNTLSGFLLSGTTGGTATGNISLHNGRHGFEAVGPWHLKDNTADSNSQTTDNTYDGFNIQHDNTHVVGNTARQDGSANQHRYGFNIAATADATYFVGNDSRGANTAEYIDNGTNTVNTVAGPSGFGDNR